MGSILVALIIAWTRVALVTRASDQPEVIGFWRSMGFEMSKDTHHSTAPPRANDKTGKKRKEIYVSMFLI